MRLRSANGWVCGYHGLGLLLRILLLNDCRNHKVETPAKGKSFFQTLNKLVRFVDG